MEVAGALVWVWPLMIDAVECRDRAKDCANLARTGASLRLRSVYSSLAQSWATLATQIERQIELHREQNGTEADRRGSRQPAVVNEVEERSEHRLSQPPFG